MTFTIAKKNAWMLVVPLLLLAALLASRRLTYDAFSADEVASMIVAGGAYYGPFTALEAWDRVADHSPDQAIGLALILSSWGQIAGWSEAATRALALFAGLLALAWLYRLGKDLFSPTAGWVAVLILSSSIVFISYMHIIRVFSIVTLMTCLTLWCYWRVALHPKAPGVAAQIGLLLGCIGLLYSHYFAALLLVPLGLYHLLLVAKNRRWWRTVLLMGLAGLAFIPELAVFIRGAQRNLGRESLHEKAMLPGEALVNLVFYFSNGAVPLLHLSGPAQWITLGGLAALFGGIGTRGPKPTTQQRNLLFLLFVSTGLLVMILLANAVVQVMTPTRIRYMIGLWPLLALLLALGLLRLRRIHPLLGWTLIILWAAFGLWRTLGDELEYQFDLFTLPPLHRAHEALTSVGFSDDLLVIDGFWRGDGRLRDYYLGYEIPTERWIAYPEDSEAELEAQIKDRLRVWLAAEGPQSAHYASYSAALDRALYHCRTVIDDPYLMLDLYAQAAVFCPADRDQARLVYDEGIRLLGLAPLVIQDGQLQVDMHWQVDTTVSPDTYSVGLYVFPTGQRDVVAQMDFGLPVAPSVPIRQMIDLSDLAAGDYQLGLTVYAWQSGERLAGRDGQSGAAGELLLLDSFSIR